MGARARVSGSGSDRSRRSDASSNSNGDDSPTGEGGDEYPGGHDTLAGAENDKGSSTDVTGKDVNSSPTGTDGGDDDGGASDGRGSNDEDGKSEVTPWVPEHKYRMKSHASAAREVKGGRPECRQA
jgi:hypothetical protein